MEKRPEESGGERQKERELGKVGSGGRARRGAALAEAGGEEAAGVDGKGSRRR